MADLRVETDLQRALDWGPQAVIISNPTALHLDIAIPAAQAGCALLLEKPVSHSLERLDELQAAVQRNNLPVLVGYQFRFHPGLLKLRRLLLEGSIGRPLSAHAHWGEYLPNWHPWEDYHQGYSARADLGGGVVLTLSHPLDYLRWLFGDVQALWAFAGCLGDLDLDVEDSAEIGLRFQFNSAIRRPVGDDEPQMNTDEHRWKGRKTQRSGILASLHLDYLQRPPAHWLEIIGTEGVLRWDNVDGAVKGQSFCLPAPPGFERNDMFLDEMRHFVDVAQGLAQPICTLDDGVQALRLALAALESAEKGQMIQWELNV
jgi:predicted dehydrogenase